MGLKSGGKAILIGLVVAVGGLAAWKMDGLNYFAAKQAKASETPTIEAFKVTSPAEFQHGGARIELPKVESGCQINVATIPWNAEGSLNYANGGVNTQSGSLMDKRGVKMHIDRVDAYDAIMAQQVKFAEAVAKGDKCPKEGAAFAVIMGDGYPAYATGAQETMRKLGQQMQVVAALGYSRGEDKCVIDKNANPRGSLIAGVPGDGDVNICIQYAADNGVPVNADQRTYDPDAMNFVNVKEFTEADEKFIAGYVENRINTKTHKSEAVKVNGSATWTPGDVKLAQQRGNLKVLASTKEYMWQMPAVVIGNKQWMEQNSKYVENMLAASFEAGELVRSDANALSKMGDINALVYKEQNGEYWAKYYKGVVENGILLGGSTSNGLGDNLFLFGLNGNDNIYKRVYTVFGGIASKYFDTKDIVAFDTVVNTNYLRSLATHAGGESLVAAKPTYDQSAPKQTFAKHSVSIEFSTGKAEITSAGIKTLNDLLDQLSISGLRVQVNGHTDNVGDSASNQLLSKKRADAIKDWLMANAGSNFPSERISTRGYGDTEPVADNKTAAGKAQNRRVEIILLSNSK